MRWRTCLGLVAVLIAVVPAGRVQAELVAFSFPALVDYAVDSNSPSEILSQVPYPVVGTMNWATAGDMATISFSYDTNAGAPHPNQPNLGFYYYIASLQLQFPGLTLSTNNTEVAVKNDITYYANDSTLYDAIEVHGWLAGSEAALPAGTTVPANIQIAIRLLSKDLTTLASGHLPAHIDLSDFSTRRLWVDGQDLSPFRYEWLVTGTLVPEPSTLSLLSSLIGVGAIAMVRARRVRKTRQLD